MSWYTSMLTQTATYWALSTKDAYGNYSYAAPQSIACHWEDKQEEFITADGEKRVSQSIVNVDTDLQTKGYLYLGTSAATNPGTVAGAHMIQAFAKIPSIRGDEFERVAWL